MGSERVLGYDLREALETSPAEWSRERRIQYLLRPDVVRPISIDSLVWPRARGLEEQAAEAFSSSELFLELAPLRASLRGRAIRGTSCLAAFTWVGWCRESVSGRGEPGLGEASPDQLPEGARLLGFDVTDSGFISGLTNCSLAEVDRTSLAGRFSGALNDHHLFSTLDAARAFGVELDALVLEHAPFTVIGVCML